MARILVAGCGYVGSVVCRALKDEGHAVFGLGRGRRAMPVGVESVVGDLTTGEGLERLPSGLDVVFFTAAPDARDEGSYRAIYVQGLSNLVGALSLGTRPRLIFTSSTAVYGQDDGSLVDETSPTRPTSFRGRILLEAESIVAAQRGVVVRLAGIYGPGRARLLSRVRRGEGSYVPGRFVNLIHRDDAAGVLVSLMSLETPQSVYIGVDCEPVDSEVLVRYLAESTSSPPPAEDLSGHGKNKRCSNRRLIEEDYVFSYPSYREGFANLMADASRGSTLPLRSFGPRS